MQRCCRAFYGSVLPTDCSASVGKHPRKDAELRQSYGSIRNPQPEAPIEHRMIGNYVAPSESTYNKYDSDSTADWFGGRAREAGSGP